MSVYSNYLKYSLLATIINSVTVIDVLTAIRGDKVISNYAVMIPTCVII